MPPVHRYEGIDESRADELKRKVDQSLMPRLSKLPGFSGYFLIESGKDGMTSFGVFETPAQGEESTRVATKWLHEEKLDAVLPESDQGDRRRSDRPRDEEADPRVTAFQQSDGSERARICGPSLRTRFVLAVETLNRARLP